MGGLVAQMKKLSANQIVRRERRAAFVRLFDGTVRGTIAALKREGIIVSHAAALDMYHDPVVRQAIRERAERMPGVLQKQDLQEFWTRVAEGAEAEPVMVDAIKEVRTADPEFGEVVRQVEVKEITWVPVDMKTRLKASELLARSQGLFMDKVQLEGDLKISVTDLLDGDLAAKAKPAVVDVEAEELADLIGLPEPQAPAKDDFWG